MEPQTCIYCNDEVFKIAGEHFTTPHGYACLECASKVYPLPIVGKDADGALHWIRTEAELRNEFLEATVKMQGELLNALSSNTPEATKMRNGLSKMVLFMLTATLLASLVNIVPGVDVGDYVTIFICFALLFQGMLIENIIRRR